MCQHAIHLGLVPVFEILMTVAPRSKRQPTFESCQRAGTTVQNLPAGLAFMVDANFVLIHSADLDKSTGFSSIKGGRRVPMPVSVWNNLF